MSNVTQLFNELRRDAGLDVFALAYLLNTGERNIRRCLDNSSPVEASDEMISMLSDFVNGDIPRDWADWPSHGVDKATWRPLSGPYAARELRGYYGADALAFDQAGADDY